MCGVIGRFHYQAAPPRDDDPLQRARDALAHRGPDRTGLWVSNDRRIALAHRRLTVLDESSLADQPMATSDGSLHLVFNGEIYNHAALRHELEGCGHRFRTPRSDTEVILHAYRRWGMACVTRLRGMFAFALWDEPRRELWLARDRVGIKPLFYTDCGGRFLFSSEIGPLIDHLGAPRDVRAQGIYDFLTFLTVPAPHTMFSGIYKLEAGTSLKVTSDGHVTISRYWDAADYLNDPSADDDDDRIQSESNALIEEAIALTSASDAPCGATLSGGIDSSLILATLRARQKSAFAVVIDYESQSPYSESAAARQIALRLGIDLNEHIVTAGTFQRALETYLTAHTDSPVASPDVILFRLLAGVLRSQDRVVCLVGEGADELGGYPSYLTLVDQYPELARFAALPSAVKAQFLDTSPEPERLFYDVARGDLVIPRKHVQAFAEAEKTTLWCGQPVSSSYDGLEVLMRQVRTDTDDFYLRQVSNIEFKMRLPEFMLARIDYPTMQASVEARVPFLDHKLVEYTLRLPFRVKLKNRQPKFLIRQALARYLDESVTGAKKVGFGRVLTPFLSDVLPSWFESDVLAHPNHALYNYVRSEFVRDLWVRRSEYPDGGFKLWTLYALARWLQSNN
jgi:asparagine synthase (glutamine-hydrolysing)